MPTSTTNVAGDYAGVICSVGDQSMIMAEIRSFPEVRREWIAAPGWERDPGSLIEAEQGAGNYFGRVVVTDQAGINHQVIVQGIVNAIKPRRY